MDEVLARKVSKQLRILNFFLILFSTVFLTLLIIVGLVTYRAVTEVKEAQRSLDSLQTKAEDSLDLRSNLCDSTGTVSTLLKNQSDVCN